MVVVVCVSAAMFPSLVEKRLVPYRYTPLIGTRAPRREPGRHDGAVIHHILSNASGSKSVKSMPYTTCTSDKAAYVNQAGCEARD